MSENTIIVNSKTFCKQLQKFASENVTPLDQFVKVSVKEGLLFINDIHLCDVNEALPFEVSLRFLSFSKLYTTLQRIDEQPIVLKFRACIWLSEVVF